MIYVTRSLLAVLLERARETDPSDISVLLDTTPAGRFPDPPTFDGASLDPDTPVLTHFYLPEAGGSVSAVFGMDLTTPAGRARFLSHPDGHPRPRETDDLAAIVLIAVPPYEETTVTAFDRHSRSVEFGLLDADPPEERLGPDE